MGVRNVSSDTAEPLASLIGHADPGHVSSRSLTSWGSGCDITLLSFADGESVSDEEYPADTLYYLLEGSAAIVYADGRRVIMAAGEVLCVPAGARHAVEPDGAIKLVQVAVP